MARQQVGHTATASTREMYIGSNRNSGPGITHEGKDDVSESGLGFGSPTPIKSPSRFRIGAGEAFAHLVRGNLGPGTLNLPYAFARVGWARGMVLLLLVTIQGVYSMVTLVKCKRVLLRGRSGTYMDAGYAVFGVAGRTSVQVSIAIVQIGVCCVFIQLISTNLEAALSGTGINGTLCTLGVTAAALLISLLRYIHNLRWLTMAANAMMAVALLSSTIDGFVVIDRTGGSQSGSGEASDIFFFLSSMFYAFEGISVIVPVENSYTSLKEATELAPPERYGSFIRVLVAAMGTVSASMLLVGAVCGVAFSDISSGSITAYLAVERPNPWFRVVNAMTLFAVFMTFPLQMYPAVEVINEWFGPGCRPRFWESQIENKSEHIPIASEDQIEEEEHGAEDVSCSYYQIEWIVRRCIIVCFCGGVALTVSNLALLLSLVGSIGSPSLVVIPSLMHLRMQWTGRIQWAVWTVCADLCVLSFSVVVAVAGAYFAISDLIKTVEEPKV